MENRNLKKPNYKILLLILTLILFFFYLYNTSYRKEENVKFDTFISNINEGKYEEVKGYPYDGYTRLEGYINKAKMETSVALDSQISELSKSNKDLFSLIKLQEIKKDSSLDLIYTIIMGASTIIFLILIMGMFSRNNQNGPRGAMNFGKSRAKLVDPNKDVITTFNDVAGAQEEKVELMEVVDFLKNPEKYKKIGAKIPKGILMVGHPGTGKTLLARAVAGEAKVPFYTISGSDFVEMYVGVGASRVRDLFNQAKENSPCIIFLDEIDAVGRQRGTGYGGGHDEREQTLNQLLVEMDGFKGNEGIVIMAATNRVDVLDPALLRPGRFDRQIHIDLPDSKGREDILKIHTRNKPLNDDVNLGIIAKTTTGFSGAELENLSNEAALLAARENREVIKMVDFEKARSKVQLGPERKSRIQSEYTNKLTAYHEAGHAIVSRVLPNVDPVTEVSIIPRGGAGGYTMHLPIEDTAYTSRSQLVDQLSVYYGGRCAEKLILNDISTGAKSDIDRATKVARAMVMEYGMSDAVGNLSFESQGEVFLGRDMGKGKPYSTALGDLIDKEIKLLVDDTFKKSEQILLDNIDKLHLVAKTLLEKETIDGYDFEMLFTQGRLVENLTEVERREANEKVIKEALNRKYSKVISE